LIGRTISHYKILEKLGEGGMGVVYKAEDIKLRRTVALKFLSPHATGTDVNKTRFVHEAMAAAGLDHPGICTVYEIDEAEDQVFIAMALIEGRSLEEKIAEGPLDIGETIDIMVQVADGLAAAHNKGVVHRDIKPGNIMIGDRGRVKIMDFGLARFSGCTTLTSPGATVGTVPYMSPEQATGRDLDHRTDIWSLGAVTYEMLTGRRPFRGDSSPSVVYSIVEEEPEPVTGLRTGVPIELDRIILKAMAKDPGERYQNAADLIADLRALRRRLGLGSDSGSALTRRVSPSGPRQVKRRRRRFTAVALAAAAILLGAVVVRFVVFPVRLSPDLVVVLPLENRTADPSLEYVGRLAAETITEGLSQTGAVKVVPAIAAPRSASPAGSPSVEGLSMDEIRDIAGETGAGTVVSGAYYSEGGSLRIRISVTDAARRELVYAFPDVAAPLGDPARAIDSASQHVMGLLAADFDPTLDARPPRYDAYREFMTGMEVWSSDFTESAEYFLRSSQLDSTYFWPRLMAAHAFALTESRGKADSLFSSLESEREALTPFERLNLDWSVAFVDREFAEGLRRLRQVDDTLEQSDAEKPLHRMSLKRLLGLHALLLNRPAEALAAFDEALEHWEEWEPREMTTGTRWELWVLEYACTALHMLGEHERELEESRRAARLYPDELNVRLCELRALAALGRTQDVKRVMSECVALRSESGLPSWFVLTAVCALRAHGHIPEAIELAEEGISLCRDRLAAEGASVDHTFELAELLYAAERWEDATREFAEVAASRPEDADCVAYLGAIAARQGERAAALQASEWLKKNEQPYRPGGSACRRARIAALLGDHDRAVRLLREAMSEGAWLFYGLQVHTEMDLEPLRDYAPFQEFMRPKG
jgi:tetratricopeptide (TPR) repeat protein/TolB-like protein